MLSTVFLAVVSIAMGVGAYFYQRRIFKQIDAIRLPLQTLGAKPLPVQWDIVVALSFMPLLAQGLWDYNLRYGITAFDLVAYPVSFLSNILVILFIWFLWMRKARVTDIVRRYHKLAIIWFFLTWFSVAISVVTWVTQFTS